MEVITEIKREKITSGAHQSYWTNSVPQAQLLFKKLEENIRTDVVIVGGGIAGISIAYCLLAKGKRVVLIEDGMIGSGETGRTTAHLVTALDDRYFELSRMYGEHFARLAADSHSKAIDFIESTVRNENIDCEFERLNGYLFLHPSDNASSLPRELEAAKAAGLPVDVIGEVPGMLNQSGPCLRFQNQGQFHPLKYIAHLSKTIIAKGGMIFTSTHAKEISSEGVVTDTGFVVSADHVVIATNSPVNNKFTMHLKQYAYRTYVIGVKIRKGSVPNALWWDTGDHDLNSDIPPYHYVRVQKYDDTHDLLICGGEDHPTGLPEVNNLTEDERYKRLEIWLAERFEIEETVYKWSGQVMEPMDSLAFIGRNPGDKDNVYIVTGDSGNGMTHGTIAGMLISDMIAGIENPWEDLYDPSRFKILTAGKTFFKELVGGFIQYLKTLPDTGEIVPLHVGEAEIIKHDGEKFGVFMDEQEYLHIVSTKCMHLGCTVKWNQDERTWDCPCHGSRYTYEGKVINGPANMDLPYHKEQGPLKLDEDKKDAA
jgi:glycine/D-amino acid oxidase-like deaminating enzyme/nitrite reductase/ring-hydroxylating ferredoxin subunit